MESYGGLTFEQFTQSDIERSVKIMKRAFDEDAKRHLGRESGGPEGYDNGDFFRKWYINNGSQSYKISKDGELIGGVNVFINDNNINYLGNIFIEPLLQDKGIGITVWRYIEQKYPETKKWRTETPGYSKRNHHFYINKCGFKVVKIENPKDIDKECYLLEKQMQ